MKTTAPLGCLAIALLTASLSAVPARATIFDQETKLTASDAAVNDNFGGAVAISGNTALAGAFFDDDGGFGSAYLFKNAIPEPSSALLLLLGLATGLGRLRNRRRA